MRTDLVYVSSAGAVQLASEETTARAPLAVIADFVDESIERIALPRVRGPDEARLLARRLAQQFPDTPYRLALPLRGQPGPDTHVLVGVPAGGLDALLAPAVAAGREVLGVWTVALLVAWWVRRAGLKPSRQLVVVPTPAGVRHVFLLGGMPVVSRLIPRDLAGQTPEGLMGEELERTVQYLYNARLAERDRPLPAWGFGLGSIDRSRSARAPVRWEPVPSVRGLPDVAARGLVALAELLAQRPPRAQLAPAALRVHTHARLVKRIAAATAGVTAAVLTASAALAWSEAALRDQAAAAVASQAADLRRAHQVAQAAVATLGTTAQAAAQSLEVYAREIERAPQPGTALATLAHAFDATPAYRLNELHWRALSAAPAASSDAQPAVSPDAQSAGQTCSAAPGLSAEASVYLAGEIAAATSLRQTVAARERFEAQLAARVAGVQVLRAPIEPAGPLAAQDGPRPFAYCVYLRAER
jgi:hypothetical protein